MNPSKSERECKRTVQEPLKPDPLSERPAPCPGQKWSLTRLQDTAHNTFERVQAGDECFYTADEGDDWFRVLLGNYPADPQSGTGGSKIPALPNLCLYLWYIPPWYDDEQTPHN